MRGDVAQLSARFRLAAVLERPALRRAIEEQRELRTIFWVVAGVIASPVGLGLLARALARQVGPIPAVTIGALCGGGVAVAAYLAIRRRSDTARRICIGATVSSLILISTMLTAIAFPNSAFGRLVGEPSQRVAISATQAETPSATTAMPAESTSLSAEQLDADIAVATDLDQALAALHRRVRGWQSSGGGLTPVDSESQSLKEDLLTPVDDISAADARTRGEELISSITSCLQDLHTQLRYSDADGLRCW